MVKGEGHQAVVVQDPMTLSEDPSEALEEELLVFVLCLVLDDFSRLG